MDDQSTDATELRRLLKAERAARAALAAQVRRFQIALEQIAAKAEEPDLIAEDALDATPPEDLPWKDSN